jgi:hypothetical protein
MSTVMASVSSRRPPISSRVSVAQLRERLEILFRTARSPGIHTVSALDRTLGLEGQRSFRQYYRGDRPSGIPGELVAPFLKLFNLRLHELVQPLSSFERQMESEAHGAGGISWHDAQILTPRQEVTSSGEIRFSWPDSKVELRLVPCSPSSPLILPNTAHAAGSPVQRTRLRGQSPFHLEISQSGAGHSAMLGLLEGKELVCFLEPGQLASGERQLRLADALSLETGPCSLWLLPMSAGTVADTEVQKLHAEDTRTRRLGAEAIYAASRGQGKSAPMVLRAELEVVS